MHSGIGDGLAGQKTDIGVVVARKPAEVEAATLLSISAGQKPAGQKGGSPMRKKHWLFWDGD